MRRGRDFNERDNTIGAPADEMKHRAELRFGGVGATGRALKGEGADGNACAGRCDDERRPDACAVA